MRGKTIYTSQEVDIDYEPKLNRIIKFIENLKDESLESVDIDCEYDVNFDDLMELIYNCNDSEKAEIKKAVTEYDELEIRCDTLYDVQKFKVLKVAFEKYDLEELLERLDIKYSDY